MHLPSRHIHRLLLSRRHRGNILARPLRRRDIDILLLLLRLSRLHPRLPHSDNVLWLLLRHLSRGLPRHADALLCLVSPMLEDDVLHDALELGRILLVFFELGLEAGSLLGIEIRLREILGDGLDLCAGEVELLARRHKHLLERVSSGRGEEREP